LWIDNTPDSYEHVLWLGEGKTAYEFSEALKEWAFETIPETSKMYTPNVHVQMKGFLVGMMISAVKQINFFAIAESYVKILNGDQK
jgi:hypothetical protein